MLALKSGALKAGIKSSAKTMAFVVPVIIVFVLLAEYVDNMVLSVGTVTTVIFTQIIVFLAVEYLEKSPLAAKSILHLVYAMSVFAVLMAVRVIESNLVLSLLTAAMIVSMNNTNVILETMVFNKLSDRSEFLSVKYALLTVFSFAAFTLLFYLIYSIAGMI